MGALLLLIACAELPAKLEEAVVAAPTDPVERAVDIARAIQADPDNSEATLAAKGITDEELDALLYEIAADPAKSEAYSKALEAEEAGEATGATGTD